ncbi:MAG: hypothetical protein NT007_02910 [Candidatus Kapabacteria bacterium]|nr:hypothetical protein [Candidatus Kapabacteria bacterium]
MKFRTTIAYLTIISLINLVGCTTTKPIFDEKLPKDGVAQKNDIINFVNPQFKNEPTAFYSYLIFSTSLAAGAGGGYIGYQSEDSKVGKAIGYGLVSFLGTYVILAIYGPDVSTKPITIDQGNKWLEMLNPSLASNNNYFLMPNDKKINNLILIPKIKENNYIIENYNDAFFYNKLFPSSQYTTNVLTNSINTIPREDIPDIIELYNNSINTEFLQYRYLNLGKTFVEYKTAYKKYPKIKIEAEKKCAIAAYSIDDFNEYLSSFPDGASYSDILKKRNKAQEEIDKEQQRIKDEAARQETERIEKEKQEKIQKQKALEERKKHLTTQDKERIKLEISKLETDIRIAKDKKEKIGKDMNYYGDLSWKTNNSTLRDEYKQKSFSLLAESVLMDQEISKIQEKLGDLYDLVPELK